MDQEGCTYPTSAQSKDAVRLRSMMTQAGIGAHSIDWSTRVREAGMFELDSEPQTRKGAEPGALHIAERRDTIPLPDFMLPDLSVAERAAPVETGTASTVEHREVEHASSPAPTEVVEPLYVPLSAPLVEAAAYAHFAAQDESTGMLTAQEAADMVDLALMEEDSSPTVDIDAWESDMATPAELSIPAANVAVAEEIAEPKQTASDAAAEMEAQALASAVRAGLPAANERLRGTAYKAEDEVLRRASTSIRFTEEGRVPPEGTSRQAYKTVYTNPVQEAYDKLNVGTPKEREELFIGRPKRNRKKMGVVAMTSIAVVGGCAGLALYAGGGDLLSQIFTNRTEQLTLSGGNSGTSVPAGADSQLSGAVAGTDTFIGSPGGSMPVTAIDTQPVTGTTMENELPADTQGLASAPTGSMPTTSVGPGETAPGTTLAAQSVPAQTGTRGPDAPQGAAAHSEPAATRPAEVPAAQESAAKLPAKGTLLVQVRATTDQSEAKRIVKRLKSNGLKDVTVEKTQSGARPPLHRIRFTFAGTKKDAVAAAEKAGYSGAWVIR